MTRRGAALLIALVCARPAHAALPRLEPTARGVEWHNVPLAGRPRVVATPLAAWWETARGGGLLAAAVAPALADTFAARRDTLRADSLLADAALAKSVWAWDALRRRTAYRLAHADTLGAARLLEAADRTAWPAADDVALRAQLAALQVALRDTLAGEAAARQILETQATVGPGSGEALALLERLRVKRGERFALPLARRAARAEWANGRRAEAVARMAQVMRAASAEDRGSDALQRVQWLREWRKAQTAVAAADTALRWTRGTPEYGRALLERARALRDAGRTDSSLAAYTRLARSKEPARLRVTAWWEAAREAQDASRWRVAARAFAAADSVARETREGQDVVREAGGFAGLMHWLLGERAAAEARWRRHSDKRSRFWLGVALRQRGAAEGDSILRAEFAERPGFDLYTTAARDTLRLPGWPGTARDLAPDSLEQDLVVAITRLAGPLALPEQAARVVQARDRGDARVPRGASRGLSAASWRAIALAAYAGGDLAAGTRGAERALLTMGAEAEAWDWIPWAFPPAYESELTRAADAFGIERELLWGLTRQESRFDPRAVSRSNARGLTQLLSGTARDVARMLRETLPADTAIFEPDRALRYGARYLRYLLDRFDGSIPVALAAYNAGPGKVRDDWRELLAHGGWALYCEMASNADTQDYVRRILGFRQAYRTLKPTAGVGP